MFQKPESQANEHQEGGDHYKKQTIQPWDYIVANNIGFLEGNAIKYLTRHKEKNGRQDILKAKHYIEKLLEQYPEDFSETAEETSEE